jgi:hypothetical protein
MVRTFAYPDYCERSDDVQLGFGDNECVAAAPGRFVNRQKPRLIRKSWCGNLAGDFGSCFSAKKPPARCRRYECIREMQLGIIPGMTYMTVTYVLQHVLQPEQFKALGQFANTYGLQRFRFEEDKKLLHFDYDASRLKETVVENVLRSARIPVLRRVIPQ